MVFLKWGLSIAWSLRHTSTYPGKERPGTPIWKSVVLPESTCPEILAMTLRFASTMPSSSKQKLSTLSIAGTQYNAPQNNPNSVMCGGISVPVATMPRLMDTRTSAPTLRETDSFKVLAPMLFVLSRDFTPDKSTSIGCSERVLLNAPRLLGAAKVQYSARVSKKCVSAYSRANKAGGRHHRPFSPWAKTLRRCMLSLELA